MFIFAEGDTSYMIKLLYKLGYKLFGSDVYLTTTHVAMIITTVVLLGFFIAANIAIKRALKQDTVTKPGGFLNVVELIVEKLDGISSEGMGSHANKFRNYIGTLFIFILFNNICGIFGLRAPTADYGVTLCLGLITFFLIHYNGIKKNKAGHFTALFKPLPFLFPINVISEVATPLSLSLRLFGNVMSGTVMLGLWYGLMPVVFRFGIPAALHCYFDLFSGAIQAYVFCMLTMVYIEDKIAD
ncbi:MAG: F0F1 ATP synthase subunit A [Lachnospiraceae bacterium]|nr:F0F1 ATP synthase subunit A [Lachnospiraceae bacterium]